MNAIIRNWDIENDIEFFKYCELESFRGTLNPSENLTEDQVLEKFRKMDEEDPIDLSAPGHQIFIVDTEKQPQVALLWLYDRDPFWRFKKRVSWIYNLYVAPDYRRRGIARMLLYEAEDWTRSRNLGSIALHVIDWNSAARSLYESMGYVLVHTHNESCFYEKLIDT